VKGKQNLRDACSKGKLEFKFSFYPDMKSKVSRKTTLLKLEKEDYMYIVEAEHWAVYSNL